MSFDFFGEEEVGIKFTQQQQMFFNSKLIFLDPEQKKIVKLGQAISFLKFANLPTGTQKKIFDNLKLTGKSTLDYTQMKKVLRGVALAQNRIQPSNININANIKTKLPQFYDDSDQQQNHQQPKVQTKTQTTKEQQRTPPLPNPPKTVQAQQVTQQMPTNQNKNSPLKTVPNRQSVKIAEATENKKSSSVDKGLKKYQDFWSTLNTEDNIKISGNQVKKMFGNSENRKQLSKIWKLCNHAHKGSLSKGELYVFITLMKSKSGIIPNQLTSQMKQIIAKIDGQLARQTKGTQHVLSVSNNAFDFDKSQNFDKTQPVSPKFVQKIQKKPIVANRLSSSAHDFDDFANFANPNQNIRKTNVNIQQPKQPQQSFQQSPKQTITKRPQQKLQTNNPILPNPQAQGQPVILPKIPEITQFPIQSLQTTQSTAYNQLLTLTNTILPQIQSLSKQNKQSAVILQQTNQFLNNIDQAYLFFVQKINELKVAQDETNHRLNQTCIRMRDVIVKQSQLINSAIGDLEKQIQIGTQRVGVLEAYSQNVQNDVNNKVNQINQIELKRHNNRFHNIPEQHQSIPSHQNIQQKSSQYGQSIKGKQQSQQDNPYNQNQTYNRKSMESMREMTQSMAIKRVPKKQNYQSISPQDGGIYRQKLMEQLREQQRLQQQNMPVQQQGFQSNQNQAQKQNGYNWSIVNRQQLRAKSPVAKIQNKHKTQESEEYQQQKRQKLRKQFQRQQQQKAKAKHQELLLQQQQQQILLAKQREAVLVQQQQAKQQQLLYQQQLQHQRQQQQQLAQQKNQQTIQKAKNEEILEAERNIKMKQVRLIQMIHFLSPISESDYPIIVQRIVGMSQAQLDATYAQLYKKYLVKVQQQQQLAQKKGETAVIVSMPNQDQFSSNSFKNTQQPPPQTFF